MQVGIQMEKVILGRLLPAGTGMAHYRNLEIEEGGYPETSLNESRAGTTSTTNTPAWPSISRRCRA